MKNVLLIVGLAIYFLTDANAQVPCVQIETILVDACGSPEGKNEMFRFRVGSNNLNTSNLSVTWDSNPWLGVCQNTKTAQDVAALNRTIVNCGWLVEPVGGILPAGREVLFITSENMDTLANSFANLQDTLIVVFQCGNASSGHFRNYATGVGTRTTVLTFSGTNGCSSSVTYEPDHLVGQNGNHNVDDGALVNFTNSIPTSYTNNGCNAPIPLMSVHILTPDTTVCKGASISLSAIAANYKNVKWKGGLGSFSQIDSLNTVYTPAVNETYPISLTLSAYKKCTGDSLSDAIIISKYANTTNAGNNIAICNGNTTTLTANGGLSYSWDTNQHLSCTNCASPIASPNVTTLFFANITDNHSCINRDSVLVTVNPRDSVRININPYDTICSGVQLVLNSYSNNGYLWSPSTALSCTNCSSPIANPGLSITYTLTSLGICSAQKQVYVSVLPPSIITISTSAAEITCTNPSVTLSASSSAGSLYYNWGSGTTTANNTVNSPGTYTVTTIDSIYGCTATASTTINQNIIPPNANIGSHTSLSCNVSSVTLTASSTTPNAVYNWGSGNTSTTKIVSSAGTYLVTITDPANGCTASASTIVTSLAGAISFTSSFSNATCGNNNGSASVSVVSGTTPYSYLWSNNGNGSSISNLGPGTYTVTINDATGCSASGSILVNATNSIGISISSGNTTCGLNNGSATATTTSGNSPYTYSWNNNGITSSISNLSAGVYFVTVEDANGCSSTASTVVGTSSVNSVTATADASFICSGDSVRVCASSGFAAYQWNAGGTSQCFYSKLAGNYYVTATDANNCTVASNHVAVNIHPQPPVSISVNGDSLTAYNSYTYQWYFNSNIIPGATSPLYLADQSGLYSVAITDTNGCGAYSLPVQITIAGVEGVEVDQTANIFPNPVGESGLWNLETNEKLMGSSCEIFNAEGRLVYTTIITSTRQQINLHFPRGIYLVRIISGQTAHSIKLVR